MKRRRNTPAKKKILQIFKDADKAICSSILEEKLENKVDRSTIYRILQSFEEDGLIHRVVDSSGKTFYALCRNCSNKHHHSHNHFHFKCLKCNQLECLNEKVSLPNLKGYIINDFFGVVNGVCMKCA